MYLQIYYPVTSPCLKELFSVVGSLYQNVIVPMGNCAVAYDSNLAAVQNPCSGRLE